MFKLKEDNLTIESGRREYEIKHISIIKFKNTREYLTVYFDKEEIAKIYHNGKAKIRAHVGVFSVVAEELLIDNITIEQGELRIFAEKLSIELTSHRATIVFLDSHYAQQMAITFC